MDEDPDHFADALAAYLRRPTGTADVDNAALGILIQRFAAYDRPLSHEEFTQERSDEQLGDLAASIYEDLIALTPQSMRDFCAKHVRMRAVPSFRIEGAVYRSRRGSYCVILTIAMMTFLHKVKKFLIAHSDPSMVVYCNRDVPITIATLRAMREEVIENFRANDPRGPVIFLDERGSEASGMLLRVQEAFIVGHEIGHLVADFRLRELLNRSLNASFGSDAHRSEYMADMIGFALVRRTTILPPGACDENGISYDHYYRLSALCEFFEIVEMGFPHETLTHPAASDRIANLVASYYGEHFAEHYNAWRRGHVRELDWASLMAIGMRPSPYAQICDALILSDIQFQKLVELAETSGPDALKRIAGGDIIEEKA